MLKDKNLCEQSSFFSITLIQHILIEHFRNVIPKTEVFPSVNYQCAYSFCNFILGYVASLSPLGYYNCFKRSKSELTRYCWQEKTCGCNDSSETLNTWE